MLRAYINSTVGEWFSIILDLWPRLDPFSRGLVLLLALMLLETFFILVRQWSRFRAARRQSRNFLVQAESPLPEGDSAAVLSGVVRYPQSHVAAMIGAGVTNFASAPEYVSDEQAVAIAERAMERAFKRAGAELKLGMKTLSAIAASAPFIGLLGTQFGILNAFGSVGTNKATAMAWTAAALANALALAAMGMLVAIFAVWCRDYLKARVEVFESEMSNTSLEIITFLNAHRESRSEGRCSEPTMNLFGKADARAVPTWEIPYDRQRAVLLAMTLCALMIPMLFASATYDWIASFWSSPYSYQSYEMASNSDFVVSPDRRYRAEFAGPWGYRSSGTTSIRIVSTDLPPAWKLQKCSDGEHYLLEPDAVLRVAQCVRPLVTWRTNEELLVQCANRSARVQLVVPNPVKHRISVRNDQGKRIGVGAVPSQLCE